MIDWVIGQKETILIVVPVFLTYVIYFIMYKLTKSKWKAIHLSVQSTALFYVVASILLVDSLFQLKTMSYIIIFHLFLLAIILIRQRYSQTEIILYDGIRLLFRLSFLIFSISYMILILYRAFIFIYQFFA